MEENYKDDTFEAHQIWKYKTRPGEEDSRVTILKVEKYEMEGVVIHISIDNVRIRHPKDPQILEKIGHVPISKNALLNSTTELVSVNNLLAENLNGYDQWKKAFESKSAGVFTISVSDIVKYIEEAINQK